MFIILQIYIKNNIQNINANFIILQEILIRGNNTLPEKKIYLYKYERL